MLEILKEKYPDLLIKKQNRYLRDKYGYSVRFRHDISLAIYQNLNKLSSSLISSQPVTKFHCGSEKKVICEAFRQIFIHVQHLKQHKKISSRFERLMNLHLESVDQVIALIDLVHQVQTQFQIPGDLIARITAVSADLKPGEQEVFRPALKKFQFRVMLNDFYPQKQPFLVDFFRNHQQDFKLCWRLTRMIEEHTDNRWRIPNSEFYTLDSKLLTFLNLGAPGLIRKIYTLKHQQ